MASNAVLENGPAAPELRHRCASLHHGEVLPDLPNTSVQRALPRTTASSPRIEKSALTGQSPYKPAPGMNRGHARERWPVGSRFRGNDEKGDADLT
jgi:hypothetical protein